MGYGGGEPRHPAEEEIRGVLVHRVAGLRHLPDNVSFQLSAALRALRLPQMRACVALTTPPLIGLIGALLAQMRGTALILWMMELYPEATVALGKLREGSTAHRIYSEVSRSLYRRAAAIVSPSELMTLRLIDAGADRRKIVDVQNWVPGEAIAPIPREESYFRTVWRLGDSITLMYSGVLGFGRELDTAMKAISRLDAGHFRAVFVGDGQMRPELERMALNLRLQNVTFRPPQPLQQLAGSLAAGDIHMVAQQPGSQGVLVPGKLYGILAAGRPVLFVGPPDSQAAHLVRESGAGVVVPPGNPESFAEALKTLIAAPELRAEMSRRGRRYYEQHFGRDRSVTTILNVIHHCTSGGPG